MSAKLLRLLFTILLWAIITAYSRSVSLGQTNSQPKQVDTTAYSIIQVPPKFPGGLDSMYQFIQLTSRYPISLKKGPLALVRLLIERDGSISNVQVAYADVDDNLVSEAKRIVKTMPKWIPGSQDGHLFRAYISIPIRFVKAK